MITSQTNKARVLTPQEIHAYYSKLIEEIGNTYTPNPNYTKGYLYSTFSNMPRVNVTEDQLLAMVTAKLCFLEILEDQEKAKFTNEEKNKLLGRAVSATHAICNAHEKRNLQRRVSIA